MERLASKLSPLYFMVKDLDEVMSTEQPCDFAYEFGDGLFDIQNYPHGFPRAGNDNALGLSIYGNAILFQLRGVCQAEK